MKENSRIGIATTIDAEWVKAVRQHHPKPIEAIKSRIEQENEWCVGCIKLGFEKRGLKPAHGSVIEFNAVDEDDGGIRIEAWQEVEGGDNA